MKIAIIAILMLLGHCIGDYVLQTDFLAKGKNRHFWQDSKDKMGWIPVLAAHAIIWTSCVLAPIWWMMDWNVNLAIILMFVINAIVHLFADWLKCEGKTNMLIDQGIHMAQIAASVIAFALM